MSKTLFEKIWDKHVVDTLPDGTIQLYIDRLYCHEVTSPQAFAGLRARGLKPFRPAQITCMPDHNIPTLNQDKPIEDPISKNQVDTLEENAKLDVLRSSTSEEWYHPCGRSGDRLDAAGYDDRLWRLPYFYARCHGRYRLRYRYERGGDDLGYPMYHAA